MSDLTKRLADLPPEKRALLSLKLKSKIAEGSQSRKIPKRSAPDDAPLSFAQERLWLLDQLISSPAYNDYIAVRLEGPLKPHLLQRSLNEIIRRHESLRTSFQVIKDRPAQVISPFSNIELPLIDLKGVDEDEGEALKLASAEARQVFDLREAPLVRARLLRLRDEEHILVIVIHHIVVDGWSWGILLKEMAELYESFSKGLSPSLPELPIQYADFALWQREWLEGSRLDSLISYWKQQLTGAPQVINLLTDRPRPPVITYRGAKMSFKLSQELTKSLEALARKEEATLFMTLLGALATLLHKYSNQEDIVIGTPILGRDRAETQGLIGVFINTLASRTNIAGNPSFRELLGRVREAARGAYAHQDLPFERLVEALQPRRDMSHTPIFQVMLDLQNVPAIDHRLSGISMTPVELTGTTTRFDLVFNLVTTDQRLLGSIDYNTDLFDASTIGRMLTHFEALLEAVADDPDRRISELRILTDSEIRRMTLEWNDTDADYPSDLCVHDLVEARARLAPEAVAVICEGQSISFSQLDRRANKLARYLRSLGVASEKSVGICIDRSIDMIVGLLGILKAGAAYLPLDPTYPRDRLSYIIEDAGIEVMLTQRHLLDSLPDHHARAVCIDGDWPLISEKSNESLALDISSESPAYVIYTSGSTGKPKGVVIAHRAAVNFLHSMRAQPGIDESDIVLSVTSLSFDIAGLEIYLPLMTGAKLVVANREEATDPERLMKLIDETSATLMQATPATWQLLVMAGWRGCDNLKVLCGGEALQEELSRELLARSREVWNMYGPTETTIWSAVQRLTEDAPITIGRPIANTRIYLMDDHLNPVPIGVGGELYIGGDGLARGYLNRPDLTADRFIPNPFSPHGSSRLYRTGDVARYLADGRVDYIGRIDHQVKVRGYRIEMGEIEDVICRIEGVNRAVVVVADDAKAGKQILAFVVEEAGSGLGVEQMRREARKKLPEYMMPARWVKLDEIPQTPNGKVDRAKLIKMAGSITETGSGMQRAKTPLEEMVGEIWKEVLGRESLSVEDNFFELGGHSLLAAQLIPRIADVFGVKIPLQRIFENPTIAAMVVSILQSQAELIEREKIEEVLAELEALQ